MSSKDQRLELLASDGSIKGTLTVDLHSGQKSPFVFRSGLPTTGSVEHVSGPNSDRVILLVQNPGAMLLFERKSNSWTFVRRLLGARPDLESQNATLVALSFDGRHYAYLVDKPNDPRKAVVVCRVDNDSLVRQFDQGYESDILAWDGDDSAIFAMKSTTGSYEKMLVRLPVLPQSSNVSSEPAPDFSFPTPRVTTLMLPGSKELLIYAGEQVLHIDPKTMAMKRRLKNESYSLEIQLPDGRYLASRIGDLAAYRPSLEVFDEELSIQNPAGEPLARYFFILGPDLTTSQCVLRMNSAIFSYSVGYSPAQ